MGLPVFAELKDSARFFVHFCHVPIANLRLILRCDTGWSARQLRKLQFKQFYLFWRNGGQINSRHILLHLQHFGRYTLVLLSPRPKSDALLNPCTSHKCLNYRTIENLVGVSYNAFPIPRQSQSRSLALASILQPALNRLALPKGRFPHWFLWIVHTHIIPLRSI